MKKFLVLGVFTALIFSCASETDKNIEKARFALDQGNYELAIELITPILEDDPNNNEAKFILGSAYIGTYALNPKPGCDEDDVGYLGLLACLVDEKSDDDDTGLQTFDRIAPEDNSLNDEINAAVEILTSIDTYDERTPLKDVALQRLVARAFAISTIYQIIGANSENSECNAGGAGVDEIPDEFDPTNLTAEQSEQFVANLEGIIVDSEESGLDLDFRLLTRSLDILAEIDAQGMSTRDSVIAVFNDSYASVEQQVCN